MDEQEATDRYWRELPADAFMEGNADIPDRLFPAGSSVLDVGCANGVLVSKLLCNGLRVTGIDLNESVVSRNRQRFPGATFIAADISQLRMDRTFDIVVCTYVLLSMVDPEKRWLAARNIQRWTGKTLILQEPLISPDYKERYLDSKGLLKSGRRYAKHFSREELLALFPMEVVEEKVVMVRSPRTQSRIRSLFVVFSKNS